MKLLDEQHSFLSMLMHFELEREACVDILKVSSLPSLFLTFFFLAFLVVSQQ